MTDRNSGQAAQAEAVGAQQRFGDLVNSIDGVVWEVDVATFRFTFVSRQAERFFGYPVDRWLHEPTFWQDHIHPEDRAWAVDFCLTATAEKRDHEFEYRMIAADGRVVWIRDLVTVVVENGAATTLRGVMLDVTSRKRAEEDLQESERKYRWIFQSARVSLWEEDLSQVKAAIDDLEARGVVNFRQYFAVNPEFVRRAINLVRIVDVNETTMRLFGARNKEELLLSLDKVFTPETEETFAEELVAIADARTSFEGEAVVRTLAGEKLSVLLAMNFPPPPSSLDRVMVSIMDISEKKRAEEALRQAQADLAHVSRVTTLGEIAASIAHEVDQPLSGVLINANACLRFLSAPSPDLDEVRGGLEAIARDGRRASDVIARIRALARGQTSEKELLDIHEVIGDVVLLAEAEARRTRARLRTELAPDLPRVLGDRVQLQQVVLNLLLNGLEAMSDVVDRSRELIITTGREGRDHVHVTVRDSGAGIDPTLATRIFEGFYTTKRGGMGMGLSISRSIVEQHGGRLWAEPNDGPGTTFHFTV